MQDRPEPACLECDDLGQAALDRRRFFTVVGGGVAAALVARNLELAAAEPATKAAKPAEGLIKELFSTLSEKQKSTVVLPWDHGAGAGKIATRMGMYNGPIQNKKLVDHYTKPQQELIEKIVRAVVSDEEGYQRISRNGTWDGSGKFEHCGVMLFGEPEDGKKFAWVFAGHHLTLRCDGDSLEGAAWGGPMYYGHSPNGYSPKNVFNFQTKSVLNVFDALDEKQRAKAIVTGNPGEQAGSVKFRKKDEAKPGLVAADMSKDQRALVEEVMRDLLSPYRKEDADEVMAILKTNGGLDKLHLAFYRDKDGKINEQWHFWRLEGPGFVWNYRVLPHVHCYVNIAKS